MDHAIHPKLFRKAYLIVLDNYKDANHQNRKNITNQDTSALLSKWEKDRDELSTLLSQLRKSSEQVQADAEKELPGLVKEARTTLERLNRIEDWKDMRADTDFTQNLRCVTECLRDANSYRKEEIREPNSLSMLYAKLDYSTRMLSGFVDRLCADKLEETTSLHSRWQGTSRETFENLLRDVIGLLRSKNYNNINDLMDDIYRLYKENDQQGGFGDSQISDDQYQRSLRTMPLPGSISRGVQEGSVRK